MNVEEVDLRWPLQLLTAELTRLARSSDDHARNAQVMRILEDAFTSLDLAHEFERLTLLGSTSSGAWSQPSPWDSPSLQPKVSPADEFLQELIQALPSMRAEQDSVPYYTRRSTHSPSEPGFRNLASAVQQRLILFEGRGYFESEFGKDCVDSPAPSAPREVLAARLPWAPSWPPNLTDFTEPWEDPGHLYDLIEVCHDLAQFPAKRWWHDYGQCGWHHESPSRSIGRAVYRWEMNGVLERLGCPLRLADQGPDRGRLVAVADLGREDLIRSTLSRPGQQSEVLHAIELFRSRGATTDHKRSACVALARILEDRRPLIKERFVRKDEGALFQIANEFSIRHKNDGQKDDYDPVFLDWVFWTYLATVELTERLIARQDNEVSAQ